MLHLIFRLGKQEVTLLVSLSRTQCAVPSGLPASSASAAPRRYTDACSATPNAASGLSCRTLYIRSASTGHLAHARRGSRAETQFGLSHSARRDGRGWSMRPFRPLRMHAGIMQHSDATDDATKRTATAHVSRRTVRSSMAWHATDSCGTPGARMPTSPSAGHARCTRVSSTGSRPWRSTSSGPAMRHVARLQPHVHGACGKAMRQGPWRALSSFAFALAFS
jgi:hypothetical protein